MISDAMWGRIIAWLAQHRSGLVVPGVGAVYLVGASRYQARGRNWVPEPYPNGRFIP